MRKAEKQIMSEFIETLYQAKEELCRQIEKGNTQRAQELLSECQEGAIQLGNMIESMENEGHVTITHIEKYCDIVYHIYESLLQDNCVSTSKIRKILNKQILKIENSIKNDIIEQLEMVFLPYKFSMWDSLESVWKAAEEDIQCKAYVIPIPYYNRSPDGSLHKMHYEGYDFPEYVPVTWYEDYDFEKRKPDVIFIHNPYDENNYVTSVHPFFYSSNLKKYTEKLVYIPYYISSEVSQDYQGAIESRANRILTNGVLNSDLVIVQSDNTKQLYVNVLEKNIPNISRKHWEDKIWGLGSPKLDRVRNTKRDDKKLSENWKKIIYNKNGNRKKVIFYNISLGALLQNPEMIDKIKDVLAFFETNEEIALWWRPHPLYEFTLSSMRQNLLKKYLDIKERYKQDGWGILDEGSDLEWAIAQTDAYYGDSSSVVQLYKETHKPIMIQKASVRTLHPVKAEEIPIWPSAFFVDGDDIWFMHGKINALMRYSMSEDYTYYIGSVPNEPMLRESLYKGIYKWGDKIYLIPCWAREIAVYNLLKREFEKISIENIEEYDNKMLFNKTFIFEHYLYCIPYYYNAILKIDMNSCNIEKIEINLIAPINDATQIGSHIIALFSHTNFALSVDLKSNKMSQIKIGMSDRIYTNISNIGNTLYLFDKQTNLFVKIGGDNYNCEEEICPVIFNGTFEGIRMSSVVPDFILLDTPTNNEIKIINASGKTVFEDKSESRVAYSELFSSYSCGTESNNHKAGNSFYYYNASVNSIYKFKYGELEEKFFTKLTPSEFDRLSMRFSKERNMITYENDIDNLIFWTGGLKTQHFPSNSIQLNCGKEILLKLKES